MAVTGSEQFVAMANVPVVPIQTTAGRAYDAYLAYNGSALMVQDNGVPLYYVSAQFVKSSLDILTEEAGLEAATSTSLAQILFRFHHSDGSFKGRISNRIPQAITVAVIRPIPLLFNAPEPKGEDALYVHIVHDANHRTIGWYLPSRAFAETIHTPPPTYTCQNDSTHRTGPDSGKCQVCSGKIV